MMECWGTGRFLFQYTN